MMFDRMNDGLWWDKAWSLVGGCTPVSDACDHCWAAQETVMRANHPNEKIRARAEGITGGSWDLRRSFNGKIRLNHEFLDKPLRTRKPTAWAVWNDLFHEDVPEAFFLRAYEVMEQCPQHIFIILTKRPEKAAWQLNRFEGRTWPLPNVWIGVTAENQQTADERIPILLQIPAAVRFVSVEPMLGPVDLTRYSKPERLCDGHPKWHCTDGCNYMPPLDWIICGGESGPGARPMHPGWVRSLRDQCQVAGVPFMFKQWGEWTAEFPQGLSLSNRKIAYRYEETFYRLGKKTTGRILDGREWTEYPEIDR